MKNKVLKNFDKDIVSLISSINKFQSLPIERVWENRADQVLAYKRGDYLFIYNLNPIKSFKDYGFLVKEGEYRIILDTDSTDYGGFSRVNQNMNYITNGDPLYKKEKKG